MGAKEEPTRACIGFAGEKCIGRGALAAVARSAKMALDAESAAPIHILDDSTSEPVEVDFRGTVDEVVARLAASINRSSRDRAPADEATPVAGARAPGRPKLGVVAREVTLLPRHWEWLNEQPGGASVTLRKLVEQARKATAGESETRRAQASCYRFMNTMAGNEPGFEEALRALYAGDRQRFAQMTETWPADIRDHARVLAARC